MDVKIIKKKGEDDSDHVQFSITEKKRITRKRGSKKLRSKGNNPDRTQSMDVTEDIEEEKIQQENEENEGSSGDDECSSSSDEEEEEIGEGLGLESRPPQMDNRQEVTEEISMMSLENKISPLTFCNAFPFHLVFDRNLHVRQVSLLKVQLLRTSKVVCLL